MASRRFQNKDNAEEAFIFVDLLPDVKRPRQFNVNVILVVLLAVFLSWLLIYWPLSGRQEQLDAALEENNDLIHQRGQVNEEIEGYRIEPDLVDFRENIDAVESLQKDYSAPLNDFEAAIGFIESSGSVIRIEYNAITDQYTLLVLMSQQLSFSNVRIELLEIDFVESAAVDQIHSPTGTSRYQGRFTIEVNDDAF